ncbi:DUF4173 domain-containing protein [Hymenobacter sp. M29]|uniref:DUF4173 domain-containing protein n=1 Tax=Hymenobacter mellowenesis TaxID=3063995 RepID=A0ABT9AAN1_9BACT|nr:DUF4173 domain-containing protein [Hymenobacter sp. M29]MDO7846898.1 DUF4173 domain-containing protein [Hymenobacter sp. M29]
MPNVTVSPGAAPVMQVPLAAQHKWALLLTAVLFKRLFWEQWLGLNGLLFMWTAVALQLWLLPRPQRGAWPFWVAVGGTLLSGVLMALYGSVMAGVAGWVSLALVLALVRWPALRSVSYALLTSLENFLHAGPAAANALWPAGRTADQVRRGWFYGRLLGLPVAALLVFHGLFVLANPRYARLTEQLTEALLRWMEWLYKAISVGHVLFWGLAGAVAGAVVLRGAARHYAERDAQSPEVLERRRVRARRFFRLPDLRKQYVVALAVFGLLNALLLLVNAIDINWLWLGYHPATALEMKQFVHEGTYVLIFSILLAMSLVLWAFRSNLNFYVPGLPWLRRLATAWVLQNAVLAVSVGLRNYYYIVATGLAYKRIGVCAFLLLTLFGLGTIGLKIWQRRTTYSLVRLNGWAAYALLLALAAGNWEVWMVRYNLQRQRLHIDLSFLLELPGRALPALHARRAVLAAPGCTPVLMRRAWAETSDVEVAPPFALQQLAASTRAWCAEYEAHRSWQSWNYADWRAYQTVKAASGPPVP